MLGDGDAVVALGERDCSLQRRHQKLVEIAPSPSLTAGAARAADDRRAEDSRASLAYRSLGTVEFLVDADRRRGRALDRLHRGQPAAAGRAHGHRGGHRPRPGAAQLLIAAGRTLGEARLGPTCRPRRAVAIQWRVNAETLGAARPGPAGGTVTGLRAARRARRPRRHAGLPGTDRRRTTTRCWPRSCTRSPTPEPSPARRAPTERGIAGLRDRPGVAATMRRGPARSREACIRASSRRILRSWLHAPPPRELSMRWSRRRPPARTDAERTAATVTVAVRSAHARHRLARVR